MVSRKFRIRYMKDAPRGRVTPTWSRTKLAIWVWLEAAARCKGVMPWSSIRFSFEISRSSLWSNWTISSEPCAHARWNAVLLSVSLGNNDTLQVTSYSGVTDTEPRIMLTRTSLSHIYRIFQFIFFLGKNHIYFPFHSLRHLKPIFMNPYYKVNPLCYLQCVFANLTFTCRTLAPFLRHMDTI